MIKDFTSFSAEEEKQFVVFEQRTRAIKKMASSAGLISAGVFGAFIVVIVMLYGESMPKISAEDLQVPQTITPEKPVSNDTVPTDTVPTDKMPTDTVPTDKMPTDVAPTAGTPTDSVPSTTP